MTAPIDARLAPNLLSTGAHTFCCVEAGSMVTVRGVAVFLQCQVCMVLPAGLLKVCVEWGFSQLLLGVVSGRAAAVGSAVSGSCR
jgi:hypothetical protein